MYIAVASGIFVKDEKILLVHHNGFDKWVFPGGHIDDEETPAQSAEREFLEETNVKVEAISAVPPAFAGDDNDTPIPLPFYMGLAREGFDSPRVIYYYYVKPVEDNWEISHQKEELYGINWFSKEDLQAVETFDQVRALARHAIDNYPKE